jgi:hypothetical protein
VIASASSREICVSDAYFGLLETPFPYTTQKAVPNERTAVNEYRTTRVGEILDDFRTLQYYIAAAPVDPPSTEDYYTEGWAALRQCALDGQNILNCAADTSVPEASGGEEEQVKAELKQCVTIPRIPNAEYAVAIETGIANLCWSCRVALDAYARRHEGQKIYLRQAAAQRWIEYREQVLQGNRPSSSHRRQLRACDEQLRIVCIGSASGTPTGRLEMRRRASGPRLLERTPTNT